MKPRIGAAFAMCAAAALLASCNKTRVSYMDGAGHEMPYAKQGESVQWDGADGGTYTVRFNSPSPCREGTQPLVASSQAGHLTHAVCHILSDAKDGSYTYSVALSGEGAGAKAGSPALHALSLGKGCAACDGIELKLSLRAARDEDLIYLVPSGDTTVAAEPLNGSSTETTGKTVHWIPNGDQNQSWTVTFQGATGPCQDPQAKTFNNANPSCLIGPNATGSDQKYTYAITLNPDAATTLNGTASLTVPHQ